MVEISLIALLVVLLAVTVVWFISLRLRDASIVDIFWGTGFIIAGVTYYLLTPAGFADRKILIMVLVIVWGLRLSLHIAYRNHGKGEDFRYLKWREEAGNSWWWKSYLKVFVLQGVILWVVSLPLLAAQYAAVPAALGIVDWIGVCVWVTGFFFEAVGDWQLLRFRMNPANLGRVMDQGLWRYTRHPNYFGDAVQWWGFYLIALAAGAWYTIISPLLMTYLLMRVSGVAMLEKTLRETKPAYRDYIQRTSAFFPMPPRKSSD
jgi:steroid 5-alpha reductase family enzyme